MFPSEPIDIGVSGIAEYGLYGVGESVFGEFVSGNVGVFESVEKPYCWRLAIESTEPGSGGGIVGLAYVKPALRELGAPESYATCDRASTVL